MIPAYEKFISKELLEHLRTESRAVKGVAHLKEVGKGGGLETKESLQFLCELYEFLETPLTKVLQERELDRAFFDSRTKACYTLNRNLNIDFLDEEYETVLGHKDSKGQVVVGPLNEFYCRKGSSPPVVPIPPYLQGQHVTLFGPPDDAKLSINAMNSFHRKIKGEPSIVSEILSGSISKPFWGADDEDSKTPLRQDLVTAGQNLAGCFEGTLQFKDPESKKDYRLEKERLALPIKRFPGLALPSFFLFYKDNPLPLHLYDFTLHLFHHWNRPEALSFYVPKLETVQEAAYIHQMVLSAERLLQKTKPTYQVGTVRLFIVLENPRIIFRVNEMMDALHPYFAGASLGWHDYLSSTARLFKNDGNYRIPVKADPEIVIKYIKASHELLAQVVGPRGGIKIGGMYGVLPIDNDPKSPSFQLTMLGFVKDVITEMKRDLSGFWVAHPDFVRLGIALVEAWNRYKKGEKLPLENLVSSLLEKNYRQEAIAFIRGSDVEGLDPKSPLYPRSLIVADIKESTFIANNDPKEIRYNVFQSLQYLTDWLSGNGCVALPAQIEGVPVRVMDDLATAERSRWEVWHELHHGRFSIETFLKIAYEEMHFIRKDLSDDKKIVQVKWDERTSKWYPIAFEIMLELMTSPDPVEFASELLLPFTIDSVRESSNSLEMLRQLCPGRFTLSPYIQRFCQYFEACGHIGFATEMAKGPICDLKKVEALILNFQQEDINEAAYFHGDIGESKKGLDAQAAKEQALVQKEEETVREELRTLGEEYKKKFGMKFLISAQGRTGADLLQVLKRRMKHSLAREISYAREALWQITTKRLSYQGVPSLHRTLGNLLSKYKVPSAQISVASGKGLEQHVALNSTPDTYFEIASLSKPIASAFTIDYFRGRSIPLTTSVNRLFSKTASPFRIPEGDSVQLTHLLEHTALNLHYVNGVPANKPMPPIENFLSGNSDFGYEPIAVVHPPGTQFQYSGGGFLVLEHLIESLEEKKITELTDQYLSELGLQGLTFHQDLPLHQPCALGYLDDGKAVPGKRKRFPAFAAGATGTSEGMLGFLKILSEAYHSLSGVGPLSHETAVQMLHGKDKGSRAFMQMDMGLGIFTAEAGPNRLMVHQGANDGFRCLFVYCYQGPDKDKGFVILCNGDNNAVSFVSEVAQLLFSQSSMQGIRTSDFGKQFDPSSLPQEQIVNQGYKNLLFQALEPDLPETIRREGNLELNSDLNLAVGAKVLNVTNQKFARAENLFSPYPPVFDPELYGRQGKIMDSWETVRHNERPCDELVFQLARPSNIAFASISTQFHLGNQAQFIRLEAKPFGENVWLEILPKTKLEGHSLLLVETLINNEKFECIRVQSYPDGGITRLGLYEKRPTGVVGVSVPFTTPIPHCVKPMVPQYTVTPKKILQNWTRMPRGQEVDVASLAFGGKILSASNEHYGPAIQVISPYPPLHMFDGFESARSREPNHSENFVIQLGKPSFLHRIELDFTYFKNNNPKQMSIEGLTEKGWETLVPKTDVKAFAGNQIAFPIRSSRVEQIKVLIFPDGGMNRVRAFAKKDT